MSGKHLVVLTHQYSRDFTQMKYLLRFLSDCWREQGNKVSIINGVAQPVWGDVLLLHVNMTIIPDDYLRFIEHYPVVINRSTRDISKRSFSQQVLQQGDTYTGAVIVKTDANCGGFADVKVGGSSRLRNRAIKLFAKIQPWHKRRLLNSKDYPVFDSLEQVPAGVWRNPDLVVEKFLPECDTAGNYNLRVWYFCGSREFVEFDTSTHPTVKGKKIFRRVQEHYVPDDLRIFRQQLGFDFGKFDFAIVAGKTVLYDINRTPTIGDTTLGLFQVPLIENLTQGLDEFF